MQTLKFPAMLCLLVFSVACGDMGRLSSDNLFGNAPLSDLGGELSITPASAYVEAELTATYTGGEAVVFQWKKDEAPIAGATGSTYMATAAGSYAVTVSAAGYNSKTSEAVPVTVHPTRGVVWTAVANNNTDYVSGIAWGDGRFVAAASMGWDEMALYSTDGISWTNSGHTFKKYLRTVAYGGGRFVIGTQDYMLACSADGGETWADIATMWPPPGAVISAAYGNGKFLVGSNNYGILYSTDCMEWKPMGDVGFYLPTHGIVWANGRFVVVGKNGQMAWSTDGTTWTQVKDSTFGTSTIETITYGGGLLVAGGYAGKMAWSADAGITWNAVENSPFGTDTVYAIAYGGGRFVAGGQKGTMAHSTDGKVWEAIVDRPPLTYIYALAYGSGRFLAGGVGGLIYSAGD